LAISNILSPLMQIAEDGGLESAIRCDIGLKTESIFTMDPDQVMEIGLIY
jgi:alanine dehydrogenase